MGHATLPGLFEKECPDRIWEEVPGRVPASYTMAPGLVGAEWPRWGCWHSVPFWGDTHLGLVVKGDGGFLQSRKEGGVTLQPCESNQEQLGEEVSTLQFCFGI